MDDMRGFTAFAAVLTGLLLVGCADNPPPKKKEPEKPAEPVTGRTAFYKMFGPARLWAADVEGLRCASIRMPQVKPEPGKAGAWECTFVSPSKRKSKTFTYSVVEGEGNLHKDVFAGLDEDFTGSGQASSWAIQAFKVDSDDALQTALKKSEDYVKKNPDKPVFFLLEQTKRFPELTWRVVWGESVGTSNYSVFIDASTGVFLEKAH